MPKECYREIFKIEYTTFENNNDMRMFEIYYINKHKPKWNTEFNNEKGDSVFEIQEPIWTLFKIVNSNEYSNYLDLMGRLEKSELSNINDYTNNLLNEIERSATRSSIGYNALIKKIEELKSFGLCIDNVVKELTLFMDEYTHMLNAAISTEINTVYKKERFDTFNEFRSRWYISQNQEIVK